LLNPIYFAASGTKVKSSGSSENNSTGSHDSHHPATEATSSVSLPTPIIEPYTFPHRDKARVLIIGCGNSSFGADMLKDGWTGHMTNLDWSATVIEQMKKRYSPHFYQHLPIKVAAPMNFVVADMTQPLDFPDGAFDLIVCKGALDAVLCRSKDDALRAVKECHRLLAPGHGIFFVVTNGNPDNRLEYLEHQYSLSHYWRGVSVQMVPKREVDEK
jgi:SAM-dependent methyltransferase